MTYIAKLGNFLLWLIIALFITGGFYYRGEEAKFEISQVNAFAILLVLCLLALKAGRSGLLQEKINSILEWGSRQNRKFLLFAFGFFFGSLFLGHWHRHMTFETHIFDMNCLHQALFYPFSPNFFHCDTCRMGTQFAEHTVFTLVPLSLLTSILKWDPPIFIFQSLCMAIPLWYFVTQGPLKNHSRHWFWFFVLFTLFSPLRNGLIFDFREDVLGCGLLLLSFVALEKRYWKSAVVLATLTMFTKENFPAVTFFYGLILWFDRELPLNKKERQSASVSIVILSIVSFLFIHKFAIPYFMGVSESRNNILRLFPGMGSTMGEFVINVLKNPFQFLSLFGKNFFSQRAIEYMLVVLIPVVIWGRKTWIWLIPGLFTMALNLLTGNNNQNSGSYHYEFIILPFLMMSVALGIRSQANNRDFSALRSQWAWALVLALCFAGRGPLFEVTDRLIYKWDRIPSHIQVKSWQADGPLAADGFMLSQFNRVQDLRWTVFPSSVAVDHKEAVTAFVNENGPRSLVDQGRDPRDATFFALNHREPFQKFLVEELQRIGGEVRATAKDGYGNDYVTLIKLSEPPWKRWCEEFQACRPDIK